MGAQTEFGRILALTDLSTNSCAGLDLAECLARRFHGRITVGYVHTRLDILREFGRGEQEAHKLKAWVREEDDEYLRALAGRHVERLRLAGIETAECRSAREGVGELMARVRPDAVCMATAGRTGLRSVLLGSVAEHTIRTARVPVFVTKGRAPFPVDRPACVMLALDLVGDPNPTARRAAAMLDPEDELVFAHAVESPYLSMASYGSQYAVPQPETPLVEEAARARLGEIVLPLGAPRRVRVEVRSGRPGETLLAIERDLKPDLVVARSHGRRGFDHLMLGSVSERLVRSCLAPVLVFPTID